MSENGLAQRFGCPAPLIHVTTAQDPQVPHLLDLGLQLLELACEIIVDHSQSPGGWYFRTLEHQDLVLLGGSFAMDAITSFRSSPCSGLAIALGMR